MQSIRSVADLIGLWENYAACAADLGVRPHVPRDWARRGNVPSEWIDPLVRAAQARGHEHVTHELVARVLAVTPA